MSLQSQLAESGHLDLWDAVNSGKMTEAQALAQAGGGGAGKSADQVMQDMINEMSQKFAELGTRYKAYETSNPFAFDEVLAKASSEERLGPYYQAELTDYVTGVERQKQAIGGERTLLTELNRTTAGAEKRNLDEAIKQSEEGFAGQGLYFSGANERSTGMKQIAGQERAQTRELQLGEQMAGLGRQESALQTGEATQRRRWGAERQTAIETDLAQQKRQEQAQWELGRMESLGPEFMGRQIMSGGLESFLQGAYG